MNDMLSKISEGKLSRRNIVILIDDNYSIGKIFQEPLPRGQTTDKVFTNLYIYGP
jgi:hypothetical protein